MKHFSICILVLLAAFRLQAQELDLKPALITPLPAADYIELEKLVEQANDDHENYVSMSPEKKSIVDLAEENEVLSHFYGPGCSWYCGGEVLPPQASSALSERYPGSQAHDFSIISAWVEGVDGNGEGEYLLYSFPGTCPRITSVLILNGYTKTEATWKANGRVKKLRMYYDGEPYAILNLEDTRSLQMFEVGLLGHRADAVPPAVWTLKFEILEVYPGEKYQDTAITELYFDGIDVH